MSVAKRREIGVVFFHLGYASCLCRDTTTERVVEVAEAAEAENVVDTEVDEARAMATGADSAVRDDGDDDRERP